jgi:acyl-CoA thioesterase-1
MKKKCLSVILPLLILFGFPLFPYIPGSFAIYSPAFGQTRLIVALGDSLTEGLGVNSSQAYPALLEERLRKDGYSFQVINAGISGETSSGALSRIDWIISRRPDIVIVCTGANDGMRGIRTEVLRKNIQAIVRKLKQENIVVVLAGMRIFDSMGETYAGSFQRVFETVAEEENVIFMPFFLEGVATRKSMNLPDGIHPNAQGYRVIAQNLYPYVKQAIVKINGR